MAYSNLAYAELRKEGRDDVHHRARAIDADRRNLHLVVVNISPGGFMARCESDVAPGDTLRITLPTIGGRLATVKWALGGRMGCAFDRKVPADDYPALLGALTRD